MRTVEYQDSVVRLIDQTLLPGEVRFVECRDPWEVAQAIRDMKVRGAPAIGVTAAYGMAMAVADYRGTHPGSLLGHVHEVAGRLKAARPTAVNLTWAVDRMQAVAETHLQNTMDPDWDSIEQAKAAMLTEATAIAEDDRALNRQIGTYGNSLIPAKASILTHCNTGALACVDYGTALGVIQSAHDDGKDVHVFVDETRPFLQGARLTAWELQQAGIPQTLISDNMAGHFMMRGAVDLVIVGADRITANGDVANKIGTYTLAVLCKENGLPFYVAAPTSTLDLSLASGMEIPIEERAGAEVTHIRGQQIAPEGVKAAHPAFDVTPSRYVTAIITEQGVHYPPFEPALRAAVAAAQAAEGAARSSQPSTDQPSSHSVSSQPDSSRDSSEGERVRP